MKTRETVRYCIAPKIGSNALLAATLCLLFSCAKSEMDEVTAPGVRVSYMNDAVVSEDGSEMTARENFMLRLDAEAEGYYRISDEEAVGTVLSFASGGVGRSSGVQTFSADGVNIKGIKPLRDRPMMLAAVDDRSPVAPLVVEFDGPEGDGFAVCSGDRRYEKVFCYVPDGDIADTANFELLRYFFRSVEYDVADSVSKFNRKIDSLTLLGRKYDSPSLMMINDDGPQYPLPPGMIYLGKYFNIEEQGKASLDMKTRWHQFSPYNNSMSETKDTANYYIDPDNSRVVVGCAPLALGQAMAYKKSPCNSNIYPKWDAIRKIGDISGSGYEKDVADFLKWLVDELHVDYTKHGTAAFIGNVRAFFANHGIKHQERTNVEYSTNIEKQAAINFVYDACSQGEPVVIEERIVGKTDDG